MICGWLGQGEHSEACPWPRETIGRIDWLIVHGSALNLSWDSDADCWEISWITLGDRTTAVHASLYQALARIYDKRVLGLEPLPF